MEAIGLGLEVARDMLVHVARGMEASKDLLTELDRAIGDSDHGIGMARGFEAVRLEIADKKYDSLGRLLQAVGTSLMASIGGASGAIFGTLFRGGGAGLQEERTFTSGALARFLTDGLAAVKARGGAKPGDKTMVDALEPAMIAARERASEPLHASLAAAAEAAGLGAERTAGMLAVMGKAKTLGERALGHRDPGAVSTHLILKLMAEFAAAPGAAGGA